MRTKICDVLSSRCYLSSASSEPEEIPDSRLRDRLHYNTTKLDGQRVCMYYEYGGGVGRLLAILSLNFDRNQNHNLPNGKSKIFCPFLDRSESVYCRKFQHFVDSFN